MLHKLGNQRGFACAGRPGNSDTDGLANAIVQLGEQGKRFRGTVFGESQCACKSYSRTALETR
jgi:hypothetical protein